MLGATEAAGYIMMNQPERDCIYEPFSLCFVSWGKQVDKNSIDICDKSSDRPVCRVRCRFVGERCVCVCVCASEASLRKRRLN